LTRKQSVPQLKVEESNEIPIMGLPLITYKEQEMLTGKDSSDKLWQVFSKMILFSANCRSKDSVGKMLIEPMLDKHEEVEDNEEYIQKAFTFGVPIENHGAGKGMKN